MFTGIIQAVGTVMNWDGRKFVVDPAGLDLDNLQIGESIAVDGCCLTVVPGDTLSFDLSEETVTKTTFRSILPGAKVNLERAMRPTDRFGGHIVQGHVDGVGKFLGQRQHGNAVVYQFEVSIGTYLIDKGSITINGISLTVVSPVQNKFEVWVIPHTLENTNLGELSADQAVNIEYDVIAKYVEKLRSAYQSV